jgi:anti-anti-sigma factor
MSPERTNSPLQDVRWDGKTCVAKVGGDVIIETAQALQDELLKLLDRKPSRVVINLQNVGFMDSSGVASLVKLLSRAKKAGVDLVLAGMQDRVAGIFEITRVNTLFDIRDTEEEALA